MRLLDLLLALLLASLNSKKVEWILAPWGFEKYSFFWGTARKATLWLAAVRAGSFLIAQVFLDFEASMHTPAPTWAYG